MSTPEQTPDPKPFPEHLRMPEATPVLETARLILRPIRESDVPAVQRGFAHWEVVKYLNGHVPWPYPDNGAAINMAETLPKLAAREKCFWAITLKGGDDELIGRIDLWADDGVTREQRGFWLNPDYWGRGIMTEAAERVTEYAFLTLGWPHLWLGNAEANTASHRVKVKQGAELIERRMKTFVSGEAMGVVWLLTHEAWLARRAGRQPGE